MLFVLAIAVDFGRLFYAYVAVQNAAKEGALYGSRNPLCVDSSNASCPDPINVQWHVQNEASNLQSGGTSLLNTQVTCRAPNGTLRQPINDCVNGDTYTVGVSYGFRLATPILGSVIGTAFTLQATSQATVIGDAFDPSGLEALVLASSTNSDNASAIASSCTLAEASSPDFYYAPCQNPLNVDQYLQFQEGRTVTFKVRIRNSGNIALTSLSYAFAVNGSNIGTPAGCTGGNSLPASMAKNAAPAYCTFTLPAAATGSSLADQSVSITAQGDAAGLPTGFTSGVATVKVVPRPRLTVDLAAAPYRLGGTGNGDVNGVVVYPSGNLTLQRQATAADPALRSPTGWLLLVVSNSGGPANAFGVALNRNGSAVSLPADCVVPPTLASGASFKCILPQQFNGAAATFNFAATATANNSQTVGGQPAVQVITQDCTASRRVMPNLVDTLSPSADKTNKTLPQAQAAWSASTITGTLTAVPNVAANFVAAQDVTAYTCVSPSTSVNVSTVATQP
jgi:hypothetical protein